MAVCVTFALGVLVTILLQRCAAVHQHTGNASSLALHPHHLVRQDEHTRGNKKDSDAAAASGESPGQIPTLLHYVYLKGLEAFLEESKVSNATASKAFFDQCQTAHRHWDSMFWDEDAAKQLLKEHYAWFIPTWDEYDNDAKRADALRVFILHHFGGLYLDLDIECYRPADESLKNYDIVLQGTGDEGINNAAMASVPGHPLWQTYAKILVERSKQGRDTTTKAPMWMTGTLALTQTLFTLIKSSKRPVSGYLGGEFQVDGSTIKIYPIGEWFVPCYGIDLICQKQFEREKDSGGWDMSRLYGRHYFAESTQPEVLEEKLRPHNVDR